MGSTRLKVLVILVISQYIIRWAIHYSITFEIAHHALITGGELFLNGTSHPKIYLLMVVVACIILMFLEIFVIGCCLIARTRKRLLIWLLAFNLIIVLPLGLSGLYLYIVQLSQSTYELSWTNSSLSGNEKKALESHYDCCVDCKSYNETSEEYETTTTTLNVTQSFNVTTDNTAMTGITEMNTTTKELTTEATTTVANHSETTTVKSKSFVDCVIPFATQWKAMVRTSSWILIGGPLLLLILSPLYLAFLETFARNQRAYKVTRWTMDMADLLDNEIKIARKHQDDYVDSPSLSKSAEEIEKTDTEKKIEDKKESKKEE